jgi:hypothetical protein
MNTAAADRIAKAVLYEGYMLYPYRPSSVKNQQRFNFGVVYPQPFSEVGAGSDPCVMQTECLIQGSEGAEVEAHVRFLQLVERSVEAVEPDAAKTCAPPRFHYVKDLAVNGQTFYSWQEAVERELDIPSTDLATLGGHPVVSPFHLSASATDEELRDAQGVLQGRIVRTQHPIDGLVEVRAQQVAEQVVKITVIVRNITWIHDASHITRDYALMRSLVSAHIVLGVEGSEFVSLLDPPEPLQAIANACHNQGTFPVLVGDEGQRDIILASPIILYDYPQIAEESAGNLFDGTEIDEILSLRIMTMTDDEKSEMRQSDERARQMLERTESMPAEQFMKLHGALRGLRPLKETSQ